MFDFYNLKQLWCNLKSTRLHERSHFHDQSSNYFKRIDYDALRFYGVCVCYLKKNYVAYIGHGYRIFIHSLSNDIDDLPIKKIPSKLLSKLGSRWIV